MHDDAYDAPRGEGDENADAPAQNQQPAVLPVGWNAVGKGSDEVGRIEADGTIVMPGDRPAMSTPMLVALGSIGGAYLLYTVGWVVGGLRLQGIASLLVSDYAYQPMFWIAVLAPVLWFLATWVITRRSKAWVRIVALLAGMAVLIPWPFVMFGSLGGGL